MKGVTAVLLHGQDQLDFDKISKLANLLESVYKIHLLALLDISKGFVMQWQSAKGIYTANETLLFDLAYTWALCDGIRENKKSLKCCNILATQGIHINERSLESGVCSRGNQEDSIYDQAPIANSKLKNFTKIVAAFSRSDCCTLVPSASNLPMAVHPSVLLPQETMNS